MENQEYLNKVKQKAQDAKISPSENAWKKLEFLLDEDKKHKKILPLHWIGIAASICVLVSLFYFLNYNQTNVNQIVTDDNSLKNKENLNQNETKIKDLVTQSTIQNQSIEKNENFIQTKNPIEKSEKIKSKSEVQITKNEVVNDNISKNEHQNIITNPTQEDNTQQQELTKEIQKVEQKISEPNNNSEQLVEKVKKRKSYVEQEVLLFSVENELHPIPENHSKKHLEVAKTIIQHLNIK